MIYRIYENLETYLQPGKVLILYGPRQVGKTTLLQGFLSRTRWRYRADVGENLRLQNLFAAQDTEALAAYVEGLDLLAIDEAQEIPNVGRGLKMLVDRCPGLRVIATGSSSFDLAQKVGEPLTGRKQTLTLYPVSQKELAMKNGLGSPGFFSPFELKERLEDFLIFGSYPAVMQAQTRKEKTAILEELTQSYLLKDVLAHDRVKSPRVLWDLLKCLAFQVGSQVSLNELGGRVRLDVKTVERYLDLLEKTFVIVRVGGFSRNLRGEIAQKQKIFFLDNGIRNGVVSQYNSLATRNDIGALWENFIMMERLKKRAYDGVAGGMYFWRTYSQQEIDLVEEREGKLFAYEMKWSPTRRASAPSQWQGAYPGSDFSVITPANYLEFVA